MRKWVLALLLVAAPAWGQASRDFDGTNDVVTITGSATTDAANNITVAIWYSADSTADESRKLFHYRKTGTSDGRAAWQFWLGDAVTGTGQKLIFQTNQAAGGWKDCSTASAVFSDTGWHHYAATVSSGTVAMWVDGQSVACTGTVASSFDDGDFLDIGGRPEVAAPDFNDGQLAQAQMFSRVLSAAEIQSLMWAPGSVAGSTVLHLALWGTDFTDLSGVGNAGSCSNCPSVSTSGPPTFFPGGPQ